MLSAGEPAVAVRSFISVNIIREDGNHQPLLEQRQQARCVLVRLREHGLCGLGEDAGFRVVRHFLCHVGVARRELDLHPRRGFLELLAERRVGG